MTMPEAEHVAVNVDPEGFVLLEHYAELLDALRESAKDFSAAVDDRSRLEASRRALYGVIHYLSFDPVVMNEKLMAPLGMLKTAAYDAGRGARTIPLLTHAPLEENKKPTGLARETIQGMLAGGLELLMRNKVGRERGAEIVAALAREEGVRCEDSAPIGPKQIITWKKEISAGRGPKVAVEAFENFRKQPLNVPFFARDSNSSHEACRSHLRLWLHSISITAGRSAPREARRALK